MLCTLTFLVYTYILLPPIVYILILYSVKGSIVIAANDAYGETARCGAPDGHFNQSEMDEEPHYAEVTI